MQDAPAQRSSTVELRGKPLNYLLTSVPACAVIGLYALMAFPARESRPVTWWTVIVLGPLAVLAIACMWYYIGTSRIVITPRFFGVARFGRQPRWIPLHEVSAARYQKYKPNRVTRWSWAGRHAGSNGTKLYVYDQTGRVVVKLYEQLWGRQNLDYLQHVLTTWHIWSRRNLNDGTSAESHV